MKLKSSFLFFVALASASAEFITNTPIRRISSLDEFKSYVLSTNHPTVVQFVEHDCQYAKSSLPLFIENAKQIAGFSHSAQVNCDTNADTKQICNLYDVKFSPQVKLFQGAEGVFKSFRLLYNTDELITALTELLDKTTASNVKLITDITTFSTKKEDPDTNKIILLPATGKLSEIPNLFKSLSLEFQAPNNKFYYCQPELVNDLLETLKVDANSIRSNKNSNRQNSVLVTKGNRGPFLLKGSQLKRGSVASFLSKHLARVDPLSPIKKIKNQIQNQEQQILAKAQPADTNENQEKEEYTPELNTNGIYRIQTKDELKKFCLSENSKPCVVSSVAARFLFDHLKVIFDTRENLKSEINDALNFAYILDTDTEPEEIADLLDFLPYPSSPVAPISPGEPKKWYHAMAVTYMNGPEKWKVNLKSEYATVDSVMGLITKSYNNRNMDKRTKITQRLY